MHLLLCLVAVGLGAYPRLKRSRASANSSACQKELNWSELLWFTESGKLFVSNQVEISFAKGCWDEAATTWFDSSVHRYVV